MRIYSDKSTPKGQSLHMSWIETIVQVVIGMTYATVLNYYLVPIMMDPPNWSGAFWMTVIFTILSVILKIAIRRFFNYLDVLGYR